MAENYYLLDDMEEYDKSFNRKAYEHLSIKELEPIFRDYYSKHLPVDVTTWIRVNDPDDNLIYKDGLGKQVCFIRDKIMRGMFYELECGDSYNSAKYSNFQPTVISTHRSKSVLLPVMKVDLPKSGLSMIFRDNFYNWKVSVISNKDITCDFDNVFNEDDEAIPSVYCEGFPKEYVFERYQDNKRKFTIEIDNDYDLYVFAFLLREWLIKI